MSRRLLEQRRAEEALRAVRGLEGRDQATRKAYTSYAKSLPATIVMAGLGQAVATAMSKAGGSEQAGVGGDREAWAALLRHLEAWLLAPDNPASPFAGRKQADLERPGLALVQAITEGDQSAYLAAQAEALAYLEWLKKFANALLAERSGTAMQGGETAR